MVGVSATNSGVVGTTNDGSGTGVHGIGGNSGVLGEGVGYGVVGMGQTGVSGYGGNGVIGTGTSSWGVYGEDAADPGKGLGGIGAYSVHNPGVISTSGVTHGIVGMAQRATLTTITTSGVLGLAQLGRGVTGVATSGAGACGQAADGVGVLGISTSTGVAAQFSGGRAQLHLVPASTTGAPTTGTHVLGELFLDKTGALYLCKTAGSPGTWKLIG